jgi:hypothetical protein
VTKRFRGTIDVDTRDSQRSGRRISSRSPRRATAALAMMKRE